MLFPSQDEDPFYRIIAALFVAAAISTFIRMISLVL